MAQLFLYLTFLLATTVGMGEGYSLSADSQTDYAAVCLDQADVNADSDVDGPDGCDFAGKQFASERLAAGYITKLRHFLASAYPSHYPIRAPPYSLS